ncbi:MAG: hypothetical protein A4E32_01084 [Methanomassiliicoccales archaeon PtaU1.Bin124]|nr:MAG: hypothetical protein A4E32_01084 [Methanomassiliicoccales archaeon PtaU1.Bin124]
MQGDTSISQTIMLVVGVIALIFSLTAMAVIFNKFKLTDPKQTLGLPPGSVRAIIALSLILIFMLSSLFLYGELDNNQSKIFDNHGITKSQMENLTNVQILSITRLDETNENNETLYDVKTLVSMSNPASTDVAKQIITTVSTLVVAVSAFYFGAKVSGKGDDEPPDDNLSPVINKISESTFDVNRLKGDGMEVTILGKNFVSPKVEYRMKGVKPIELTDVTSSSTMIRGKLKSGDTSITGKYTIAVINSNNREHEIDDSVDIK